MPTQPDKVMTKPTAVRRIPRTATMPVIRNAITALTHLISEQGTRFNTIGRFRFVFLLWFPIPYHKLECRGFYAKTTGK